MAKRWNELETKVLRENYPIFGNNSSLQQLLPNRTYNSIQQKAASLNLKVLNPWNKLKTTEVYSAELSTRNIVVLGEYINSIIKILHKCNICETQWEATPGNIIRGTGCPKCAKLKNSLSDFEKDIKAKLYVLKITLIDNIEFIKVGITRRIDTNRINHIRYEIGINNVVSIKEIVVIEDRLAYVLDLERKILRNKFLNRFSTKFKFSGYTETFETTDLSNILDILLENL